MTTAFLILIFHIFYLFASFRGQTEPFPIYLQDTLGDMTEDNISSRTCCPCFIQPGPRQLCCTNGMVTLTKYFHLYFDVISNKQQVGVKNV